jgi:CopG family nickel-responsive transcriptional regulator
MTIVSMSLEEQILQKFDEASRHRGYRNRSEAFRDALRGFIDETQWNLEVGRTTLIMALVYAKDTTRDQLSSLQHQFHEIRTMLHTHIDEINCLEIIVAEGTSQSLRRLIEKVRGIRGVKHLKFISTTSNV